jgi:hypothetical protein
MEPDIISIRSIPNERILNLRSIMRILNSKRFEDAFNLSSNRQKDNLYIIIYNSDKFSLNQWIKDVLGDKSIHELYSEAYQLGIANYKTIN